MPNFSPVVVIGAPRSGTSCIARILQQRMGYVIDLGPIKTDARNPLGYYEDERLVSINNSLFVRWKFGEAPKKIDPLWACGFGQFVASRSQYPRWGFKDPRMVGFLPWTFGFLKNPIWIWPQRDPESIVKSQIEKLGFSEQFSRAGITTYNFLIEKYIGKSVHRIDLKTKRDENDICSELTGILNDDQRI